MKSRTVRVQMENGLDARPVAMLVQEASKYDSSIYILKGDKKINAKSIMGMMTLGLISGDELTVNADGEDEENALDGIERFLAGKK